MDEQQKQDDGAPSSTEAQPVVESPNGVSVAADQSASGTFSSVPSASPASDTQAAASSGETAGEQGNVGASTSLAGGATSVVTDADVGNVGGATGDVQSAPTQNLTSTGSTTATDTSGVITDESATGSDAGNVLAGGAPLAGITSDSTEALDEPTDDHPAKPHLAALRRKIESGEAIIMADLLRLIHAIEETL